MSTNEVNLNEISAVQLKRLQDLEAKVAQKWQEILRQNPLIQLIMSEKVDLSIYAAYMTETFHYTRHNARNQALVGAIAEGISSGYQKFCFEHAAEETGHEYMALADIRSVGIDADAVLASEPLPSTETLIAYLYWISVRGRVCQRLGYSYWAESVYSHINPVLNKIRTDLNLQPRQMSFFVAHSDIDAHHAEEVKEIILRECRTEEDWKALSRVALHSMKLTADMLTEIYQRHVAKYLA